VKLPRFRRTPRSRPAYLAVTVSGEVAVLVELDTLTPYGSSYGPLIPGNQPGSHMYSLATFPSLPPIGIWVGDEGAFLTGPPYKRGSVIQGG
jgi:hypothetical protein